MLSTEMNAITSAGTGGPDILRLTTVARPIPGPKEVLIQVKAAGVNRADLMQRRGKYPPPPGASPVLGMEVSGRIAEKGADTTRFNLGDSVCALLGGGGYAEYVAVPEAHCLSVPTSVSLHDAAALPEAVLTVYANIFDDGDLKAGQTVLIHGGSSGIGSMAIQMVKAAGGSVIATVGSDEKGDACHALGADFVVNYKDDDFVAASLRATDKRGADIVLDMIGGDYVNRNLAVLNLFGRHISIATQKNAMAEIDLRHVMQKRLILTGSTLRSRNSEEKGRLVAAVEAKIWPWIATGKIKPVIFQSFALKDAAEAHKMMESGVHIGKMLLEVS